MLKTGNVSKVSDKTYIGATNKHFFISNFDYILISVLCGKTGVPISTQWSIEGYYYPIQISQFGLAAYSKNKTDTNPQIIETLKGSKSCKSQDKGFSFSGSDCGLEINPKQQTMTNLQICFDSLSPLSSIKGNLTQVNFLKIRNPDFSSDLRVGIGRPDEG